MWVTSGIVARLDRPSGNVTGFAAFEPSLGGLNCSRRSRPAQGNRVKELCGDEAREEVVIPGGDFAAESEGILSPGSPD